MRKRLLHRPNRVLRGYDRMIREQLNATDQTPWSYRDYTRKLGFGHMRGIYRIDAYLGDVLQALKVTLF